MSETREQELDRLIREQRADDVPWQRSEPGVVPMGLRLNVLDQDGQFVAGTAPATEGCPTHGFDELAQRRDRVACRACDRERKRLSNARRAERERYARLKSR